MIPLFDAIGFDVDDEPALEALARATVERGEVVGSHRPGWRSVAWEIEGGPALWVHVSAREAIECFRPAMHPSTSARLFLAGWRIDDDCEHCSGLLLEHRGGTDDGEPLFRFVAHAPNVGLLRATLSPGGSHLVRLGALGERLGALGGTPPRTGAIEPIGPQGDERMVEGRARIDGEVLGSELRTNPATGLPWIWCRLAAAGLEIETALPASWMVGAPRRGSRLEGIFRMTALLEPGKGRERPSGWARLYREGSE